MLKVIPQSLRQLIIICCEFLSDIHPHVLQSIMSPIETPILLDKSFLIKIRATIIFADFEVKLFYRNIIDKSYVANNDRPWNWNAQINEVIFET